MSQMASLMQCVAPCEASSTQNGWFWVSCLSSTMLIEVKTIIAIPSPGGVQPANRVSSQFSSVSSRLFGETSARCSSVLLDFLSHLRTKSCFWGHIRTTKSKDFKELKSKLEIGYWSSDKHHTARVKLAAKCMTQDDHIRKLSGEPTVENTNDRNWRRVCISSLKLYLQHNEYSHC